MTGMKMNETKICPYCAEDIKFEAVRCRFCHSDLRAEAIFKSGVDGCHSCGGRLSQREVDEHRTVCDACRNHRSHQPSRLDSYLKKRYVLPVLVIAFLVFAQLTKDPDVGIDCSNAGWAYGSDGQRSWSDFKYQSCQQKRRAKVAEVKAAE